MKVQPTSALPIDSLYKKKVLKILANEGIHTVGELKRKTIVDLLLIKGCGRKSVRAILAALGISWIDQWAVWNKLRETSLSFEERKAALPPIGTFRRIR